MAADLGRSDGSILLVPGVFRLAPVVPDGIHVGQRLALYGEGSILEGSAGVGGLAHLLAGGLLGHFTGRGDCLCLHMLCVMAADPGRSNSGVLRVPGVSGLTPGVTKGGHIRQGFALDGEGRVLEFSAGIGCLAHCLAGGLLGHLSGHKHGLILHMLRIVHADPGRGDFRVLLVPSVGGLIPGMTKGGDIRQDLALHGEGRVLEFPAGIGGFAVFLAGGLFGHFTGYRHGLCLHVLRIVSADPSCGHRAVVLCPDICWFAPGMRCWNNDYFCYLY